MFAAVYESVPGNAQTRPPHTWSSNRRTECRGGPPRWGGMAPSIPGELAQRQVSRKEIKKLLKRGKADFGIARRDVKAATRRAPLTDAYAGDSTNAPKGFWDWSQ